MGCTTCCPTVFRNPRDWSCKMLTQSCWISAASKRKLRLLDLHNTDNPSTMWKEVVSSCLLSLSLYIYIYSCADTSPAMPEPCWNNFIVQRLSLEVLQEVLHVTCGFEFAVSLTVLASKHLLSMESSTTWCFARIELLF